MRNARDMRDWTDVVSHLNPMMVVPVVEIERDAEWEEREMWIERLVNEQIKNGRYVVFVGSRQTDQPR